MFITDSQVHLYLQDTDENPWPAAYRNVLRDPTQFLPRDLLPLMEEASVDRAVIVPPIWAGLDNAQCLGWAREYPGKFGIMGRYDFADDNRDRLENWLEDPNMIGIRLSGQLETGDWLDVQQFGWFWEAIQRLGIPVMVLVREERIRLVNDVAERYPEATIVIDHFGVSDGNLAEIDPWAYVDDVLELAKHPRMFGKLSALPLNTLEEYPYPSQTPYIRRAYDAFGPQRLAWGTDGSRLLRTSYKEAVDHFLHGVPFLSLEDLVWMMGKTISTALNWPESRTTDTVPAA